MIRSIKVSIKFANSKKKDQACDLIDEYRLVVIKFVNILWELDNPPMLLPLTITSKVTTRLSARLKQCAGKQASGIVRGTLKKQSQRLYIYNKLLAEGKTKQARKLKAIMDKVKITKPTINNIEMELDSRFIKQDWENKTTFDGIITLASLGNKLKLTLPVKKTKHFKKLLARGGKLKSGIRLSKRNITLMLDMPDVELKETGKTVGLDLGINNTYSLSTGDISSPCPHGHDLHSITKTLSRKKRGSKAFKKAQTNYINYSFNQIDLSNIDILRIENIKYLRKHRRTSRFLSHFTYTELYRKLKDLAETNGVRLVKVNPVYTSQRCSDCGWVRRGNRKGKLFKCNLCKFTADSDINAANNIATNLRKITSKERQLHKNRKGFYLNEVGEKRIVSPTQKQNVVI